MLDGQRQAGVQITEEMIAAAAAALSAEFGAELNESAYAEPARVAAETALAAALRIHARPGRSQLVQAGR